MVGFEVRHIFHVQLKDIRWAMDGLPLLGTIVFVPEMFAAEEACLTLLVPEKFVRKFEKSLQSPVILKLPSGLEWKVKLTSCNGKVWLQKGWPEFADHLSVRRGHLLLFRYEGNSHFHVIIFDTSATEIDYPTHLHNSNYIEIDDDDDDSQLQQPKMDEVEDDIDSVEILDDHQAPLFAKAENKSPLQCPRPQKRMRTTSRSGLKPLSASERARALERARSFKSENPFFWVVIEPSYISLANLHVPKKFAERYINKKEVDFALRVLDGRSWFVHYRMRRRSGTSDSPEMLKPGWKAFAKDNNLKVGDVCIFELISNIGDDISVLQVSIDRHASHPSLG
ncbi:hypothetical protein FNV43_RR17147 [Rhamnella rubrinervis]|uniref:TF-B3 domain-containing protein n=1 Tax=Rhamnella rubrinervis TaxID=2594499 RepID=A0A8K0DWK0_9ROSA|nr:hypothetical protein FNV43_RR17147 [Rhamnella rubrinervis]